ncbi:MULTISPECIES: SapC family protein [unclassified Caulobacter]|uniref:SapC family protein n=1 Tax=unclassified Caulobacter TaxID=2648921 RepID=UPI000D35C242|nr:MULTISPECIES: SapC family protein [unclassified Caulobacter]PTS90994.1 peptidase [Caulobacter sp. HMWF009]PTT09265.1 peptidase [Caulobacter sp. HMWF025]
MESTQSTGGISGNVLFYVSPEPLNREQHAKLALVHNDKPYGFAATGSAVPLTVTEFAPAALSFPVIFAGEDRVPLAVMGLNNGENLFVNADGSIDPGVYIPAYIRRYPFVLANDETQDRLIVCIDRGSTLLSESGQTALFDEKGEPTEYTQNCIKFCDDFEAERRRTDSFVQLLKELDLFELKTATFTPTDADGQPGQAQTVAEYFGVSEEKLNALPVEKLKELQTNGALAQIYAHLVSLVGWDRLIAVAMMRQQAAG